MYESHFGFHSRPFSATPSADRFFPNETSQRAFHSIVDCVQRATGAALIVGGSGLGKSVLLMAVARHFQSQYSVAVLESAGINSRKELLQNILYELGMPFHGMEEGELRLTLMDYLKPSDRCPQGLLLCVDEAHLLTPQLLEELRMITNLVRNGQPRARLVIAGHPGIEELLAHPQLESLSQRISCRCYLEPLNAAECRRYMSETLQAVGQSLDAIFDGAAVDAVYVATHGIPRLINQVCDHALVLAVADGERRVNQQMINDAWSDIQRLPVDWNVLGAQAESSTEHVIEFGELNSSDAVGNTSDAMDYDSASTEAAENLPEYSLEETVAEGEEESESSEPVREVAQEEPFVFEGPSNPFSESFADEEKVIDTFSQIIGHTPQRPQYPEPLTSGRSPATNDAEASLKTSTRRNAPVSIDMHADADLPAEPIPVATRSVNPTELSGPAGGRPENADPQYRDEDDPIKQSVIRANTEASRLAHETHDAPLDSLIRGAGHSAEDAHSWSTAASDVRETNDHSAASADINDVDAATSAADSPAQAEAPESIPTASLDEYLANTREAITFGVGQGFPRESDPVSDWTSADPGKSEPANPTVIGSEEESEGATLGELESEISQTVEDLQASMEQTRTSPADNEPVADAHPSPDEVARGQDDRDMIVVDEEESANDENVPTGTLPIREETTQQTSSQARREDYRQLFNRLRNG